MKVHGLYQKTLIYKKLSGTLWFSINGSNENDSIQLIKYSHKNKLFNHKYIKGQGYFSADLDKQVDQNLIYTVKTKESEAVLFHPLTLHRSVAQNNETINMRPRYSIDIRYYDNNVVLNYNTNIIFKLKNILKIYVEIIIYSFLLILIFAVLFYLFKRKAKKKIGLDKTDKPPEDIYPLY